MHPKALVETVGSFQYPDLSTDTLIRHDRPTVVEVSPYVTQLQGRSLLTLIRANLPEGVTDVEFAKRLAEADGDAELAIEAYVSEFDEAEPAEPTKGSPSADQTKQSQTTKSVGKAA